MTRGLWLTGASAPRTIHDFGGFDHGAWVPMRHLYPLADVPLVQRSMPADLDARTAAALGAALRPCETTACWWSARPASRTTFTNSTWRQASWATWNGCRAAAGMARCRCTPSCSLQELARPEGFEPPTRLWDALKVELSLHLRRLLSLSRATLA